MDAKPHRSKLHRLSEIIYFSRQLGHILRKNGVNPSLSSFLDIIRRLRFSFETPQQTPSWTYIRSQSPEFYRCEYMQPYLRNRNDYE